MHSSRNYSVGLTAAMWIGLTYSDRVHQRRFFASAEDAAAHGREVEARRDKRKAQRQAKRRNR